MFKLAKQVFIALLTFRRSLANIVNAIDHIKFVSLDNQQCNPYFLPPNEYIQRLLHYPFAGNLDRCKRNYDTHNDLSNRVYVTNKTEDLNLS